MLQITTVEELLTPFFEEHKEYSLYSVEWVNEFGYKILRVACDKIGGINSDELGIINDFLSEKLDAYEKELPDNYMLEVCSPGAEKELRSKEEILDSVGQKINVTIPDMVYEGKLVSFEDDILTISINIKGRIKKVTVPYETIKTIRLAV
ncbi:MAG: hypothetical protein K6G28_06630 [Acholeplasmatales bacterium]|nr:hypothetical protein [Acholeplasmatales bacterium]